MQSTALLLAVALLIPPGASGQMDGTAVDAAHALVDRLAGGDFQGVADALHPDVKAALPTDTLRQVWEGLVAQVGPFEGRLETSVDPGGPPQVVRVLCAFERATLVVLLGFDADGKVTALRILPASGREAWVAPPYADVAAFSEEDVTVGAGGDWPLPGTLSIPRGDGPFPGLVLVHGSGPQDRDESLGPNRPFRDLAWGLASRGIAILRYDKRTLAHGPRLGPLAETLTVQEETVEDALAAAELLRADERVDPARVHVLGHSLGGTLIPRIAGADPGLAGVVVLAGTSRPLEDVVLEQVEYLVAVDGEVTPEEEEALAQVRAQVARVKDPDLSPAVPAADLPLNTPAAYWLDLRDYHPPLAARELSVPMLIIHGGRDYQVTLDDFQGWKDALAEHEKVTLRLYPDLNHLMMPGEGLSRPEEYYLPGNVDGAVVQDIASWITGGGGGLQ